jgi:hypothetical protein
VAHEGKVFEPGRWTIELTFTQIANTSMENHYCFEQPNNSDLKIWRYLSLSKFVNLLITDSLYFCRLDLLGDEHEGSYTKKNFQQNSRTLKVLDSKGHTETQYDKNIRMRKSMFVNCWRIDDLESEAMWKLYCPNNEGIAIQTTYSKLKKSFENEPLLNMGLVKYLNYETESFDPGNVFNCVMHKRKAFDHEKEVRIVKSKQEYWNDSSLLIKDQGILIKWDFKNVIDKIYINPYSPEWYFATIEELLKKISLKFKIEWSSIKALPNF